MPPDSREEKQSLSFLSLLAEEQRKAVRPPSYLSFLLIKLLGLSYAEGQESGEATREKLPADARLDEVHAYYFIHGAPGPDVSAATRAYRRALAAQTPREEAFDAFMSKHVEPWLLTLSAQKKSS